VLMKLPVHQAKLVHKTKDLKLIHTFWHAHWAAIFVDMDVSSPTSGREVRADIIGCKSVHVYVQNEIVCKLFIYNSIKFCPVLNLWTILWHHHCRWRAATLDLCLALMAFSSEGRFTYMYMYKCIYTCHNTGSSFLIPSSF
jgi:hypothetical protein